VLTPSAQAQRPDDRFNPRPGDRFNQRPDDRFNPRPEDRVGPFLKEDLRGIQRFYNPRLKDHLLTNDPTNENPAALSQYRAEGVVFQAGKRKSRGLVPVYRFATNAGVHFYDTDPNAGALYKGNMERIEFYIAEQQSDIDLVGLYHFFNPSTGGHLTTTDKNGEGGPRVGYKYVGQLGFVVPAKK
jgi:hypothetical protein